LNRLDSVALNIIETNQTDQFRMIKNTNGQVVQIVSSHSNKKNDTQQQNNDSNECSNKSNKNSKRLDIFDHNPITKYFYYNKDTDKKHIDQIKIDNDDFDREMFEKYKLKKATIKIRDVLSIDDLKGLKYPFKLSEKTKSNISNAQNFTNIRSYAILTPSSIAKTSISTNSLASTDSNGSSLVIDKKKSLNGKKLNKHRKSILSKNTPKSKPDTDNNQNTDFQILDQPHESMNSNCSSEVSMQFNQQIDFENNEPEADSSNKTITYSVNKNLKKSNLIEFNENNGKKRKHDDIDDDFNSSIDSTENLIEAKKNDEKCISPKEKIESIEKNRLNLSSLLTKLRDNSINRSETNSPVKLAQGQQSNDAKKTATTLSNKENDSEPFLKRIKSNFNYLNFSLIKT
jgi:hypothetical protein